MDRRGEMKIFHNGTGLFLSFWLIVVLFQESCPWARVKGVLKGWQRRALINMGALLCASSFIKD